MRFGRGLVWGVGAVAGIGTIGRRNARNYRRCLVCVWNATCPHIKNRPHLTLDNETSVAWSTACLPTYHILYIV